MPATSPPMSLRRRLYLALDPRARDRQGLSRTNQALVVAIVLSVLVAVLESEPTVTAGREAVFHAIDLGLGVVFLLEYVARLWSCVESPRYAGGLRGRVRYALSPGALVDVAALLPLLVMVVGSEVFVLRLVRLIRVLRLARLGRFSSVLHTLADAVRSRRFELYMSLLLATMLLLVSSTALYLVEGGVQPDRFGSIPRAMWWSIATLTTVGYGDAFPITALGRTLAGLTALTGVGLIAMPTGILAAAFSDAVQRERAAATERAEPEAAGRADRDGADARE